jgi:hypothetical protein
VLTFPSFVLGDHSSHREATLTSALMTISPPIHSVPAQSPQYGSDNTSNGGLLSGATAILTGLRVILTKPTRRFKQSALSWACLPASITTQFEVPAAMKEVTMGASTDCARANLRKFDPGASVLFGAVYCAFPATCNRSYRSIPGIVPTASRPALT